VFLCATLGVPGFLNISTDPSIKIGSNCFFIESKIKKNWYDAFESCRQMETDLVAFKNLEELNEIYEYLFQNNGDLLDFWIAGTDLAKQVHIWFSNGQPVSSDLWRKGEPNNLNNIEHCDNIYSKNDMIGLNDANGLKSCFYICKAPQPITAYFIVW